MIYESWRPVSPNKDWILCPKWFLVETMLTNNPFAAETTREFWDHHVWRERSFSPPAPCVSASHMTSALEDPPLCIPGGEKVIDTIALPLCPHSAERALRGGKKKKGSQKWWSVRNNKTDWFVRCNNWHNGGLKPIVSGSFHTALLNH